MSIKNVIITIKLSGMYVLCVGTAISKDLKKNLTWPKKCMA